MANLKKFKVADWADQFVLVLEVDLDKLTPVLATEINTFWGGAERRLSAEGGDVVKAVIRLYGSTMIGLIAAESGSSFSAESVILARSWTEDMQKHEGWPGADGTPTGAVGIRVIEAEVDIPSFDDLELVEVETS